MRETHEAGAATGHDVLVTTPSFGQHASGPWEVFEAAGVRARTASAAHPLTERQLIEEAEGVRALVVGLDPVTAAVLDAAPALTVVAKHGVGTDNIDLAAAAAHGVRVVNAPGSNTTAVADMTVALLLAAVRRIVPAHASVTAGRWDRFFGPELAGRTLGFGRIGQAVACRARGFDMDLIAYDPHLPAAVFAEQGVPAVTLDELIEAADVITLHLPMPSGGPLLGRAELAAMKPGSCVINTARGGLVDEEALAELLHSGHLAAAGIDVFATEPPAGNPLLTAPNAVLTPHCAAFTQQANAAMGSTVAADVVRVLRGEEPVNAVV
ncbi:phosphoglycerate dehydrogenase [Streptomyces antimycoticus]|uniref:phosphoglycerate dehydrogenase n=1 Tax=Streptomyces antimycoticus TaxID=68175 RepID=UPI00367D9772